MSQSNLEKAIIHGLKSLIDYYETLEGLELGVGSHEPKKAPQARPTATSNGIPVCPKHGKAMRPSKYKEGQYYCGAKLDDETYCREKA